MDRTTLRIVHNVISWLKEHMSGLVLAAFTNARWSSLHSQSGLVHEPALKGLGLLDLLFKNSSDHLLYKHSS